MSYGTQSLFRIKTYEALRTIELGGHVLDLGGSRKSGYHELFRGRSEFSVVNIDEDYGYDLRFDVEQRFPLQDETYDHVVCLNLLEHTFGYAHVLAEAWRVLKPGGLLVLVTPFLYRVHGCPMDFFRYTDSALQRMVGDSGLVAERIETLGSGVFAVLYQNGSFLARARPVRALLRYVCVGLDALLSRSSTRYRSVAADLPLGYLVLARKAGVPKP